MINTYFSKGLKPTKPPTSHPNSPLELIQRCFVFVPCNPKRKSQRTVQRPKAFDNKLPSFTCYRIVFLPTFTDNNQGNIWVNIYNRPMDVFFSPPGCSFSAGPLDHQEMVAFLSSQGLSGPVRRKKWANQTLGVKLQLNHHWRETAEFLLWELVYLLRFG